LTLLPLGALAFYGSLGSPTLPGAPLAARLQIPFPERSIETLIAQVEAHLERVPEDGRGWEVLAPVYMRLGRFDDAVKARRNALRFNGATAAREVGYGEALVAAANDVVTTDAKAAFERAMALDASDVKARYFIGLAAEQDGKREQAASIWRELLAAAPADVPWAELLRRSLARVEAGVPGGPGEEDVAAAADLPLDQRNEMVRGMVQRLADRLKREGSDVQSWQRLMRAYVVLGETHKAKAAAADARQALMGDADKMRRIDELSRVLGLDG
jgi:cytochrome c-type biogenesis protein CcmH